MSDTDLGRTLLTIARGAIGAELGLGPLIEASHEALGRPAATFVTLTQRGELRGCIGTLEPYRPLGADVRANAVAAAFHDPRFYPLSVVEFATIAVEVSLLSRHEPVRVADEAALRAALRPGIDGVVIEYGHHRATFLPQVWDALPAPNEFLAALKRKAGLPADFWHAALAVSRYTVTKFKEGETIADGVPT
jgi:AmmeMemoRadiSam system protein A